MSVSPIVSPANNAEGIALMPVITVLYPFAIEAGTVNSSNFFLIKKETDLSSTRTTPVSLNINLSRVELATLNEFTGKEF